MILEAILSTAEAGGGTHLAPVGVIIPDDLKRAQDIDELGLRLYAGSRSYENLLSRGEGAVNLTDNVLYFVDAALRASCPTLPCTRVTPRRIADANGVWEFNVKAFERAGNPAAVTGRVLCYEGASGLFGLCRAHGAVLEAAVAASRRGFLPRGELENAWPGWRSIVAKTGGAREKAAFDMLAEELHREGFSLDSNR
jgi:hypothetical protein